ncbi:MAG TPA: outer membrane beta-barrel protein [Chitinophagaceae bacterium]|nr:outer membrane beta-barrel protein [Chitinophagaceae bacterium]
MVRKFLAIAIFGMPVFSSAYAQDSTSKGTLNISGSVDAYYRYNFDNPKDVWQFNNFTSFTNSQNSFELGMASIKAEYSIGKVGAVIDLGFGKRAAEFSYADVMEFITDYGGGTGTSPTSLAAIKQAYVTYAPSDVVTLTFGKFATHVGYELLDPQLNRNYSMSNMFSYGPFSHTGLKADFAIGESAGVMIGIANPTDLATADFDKKFFLAQVHGSTKSGKLTGYLNFVGGKDMNDISSTQFDAVVTGTITDKFSIGYNGTVKTVKAGSYKGSWWGSALYFNVDVLEKLGFTVRTEYLDDKDGAAGIGGAATSFFNGTLSINIKPAPHLSIIPELRVDAAKDPVYYKKADKTDPTSKSTTSFVLAAIVDF